ncbi:Ubiquinone biosynthesis protein coq9, mitochondrial [Tieghemiomyces parasiticus]|uniref:Ubiquinone biosynthesis protein n=1 Tax=Tieghemiomyces parasiticus TaxID=78921 RepID=A0A9W8DQ84_9FUNG|nr:Ubiquinone biosynthesis protein coq9, mitochondrial [Tieghemiomyces parasiticus]
MSLHRVTLSGPRRLAAMGLGRPLVSAVQPLRLHQASRPSFATSPAHPEADSTASHATGDRSAAVDRIYQTALSLVPTHGWTEAAVTEAVRSLGYPPILHGIVPDGPLGLVDYFLTHSRQEMVRRLEAEPALATSATRDRLFRACKARLELTGPYISRWQEAAAILAQPSNLTVATRQLGELSDDIWHYAGDRSADMTWYTRRVSLAGVYTSTELYMTEDRSPDFAATWEFLARRLADVEGTAGAVQEVGNLAAFAARSAVNTLVSKGILKS